MKDILEVVTALKQAAANAQWTKTDALEREKSTGPRKFKINDSFKIQIQDNKMTLNYTIENKNALMPNFRFEVNPENKHKEILDFLKKEYKKITGKTVSFGSESNMVCTITPISNVTQINRYSKVYEIKGIESFVDKYSKEVGKLHKDSIKKVESLEEQVRKSKKKY